MSSRPRVRQQTPPAQRPVRNPSVAPEDVVLGGADELEGEDGAVRARGRRSLLRPASGLNV